MLRTYRYGSSCAYRLAPAFNFYRNKVRLAARLGGNGRFPGTFRFGFAATGNHHNILIRRTPGDGLVRRILRKHFGRQLGTFTHLHREVLLVDDDLHYGNLAGDGVNEVLVHFAVAGGKQEDDCHHQDCLNRFRMAAYHSLLHLQRQNSGHPKESRKIKHCEN